MRQPCLAGQGVSLLDKKVFKPEGAGCRCCRHARSGSAALSGFVWHERPMTETLGGMYLRHHHQVTGVRQLCAELADSNGEGLACTARVTEACLVQIAVGLCE